MKTSFTPMAMGGAFGAAVLYAGVTAANAPAGHFTNPSPGVIFDTKTKRTWEQLPAGTAEDGGAATAMSWVAARSYCTALNLDGINWRLPTEAELLTLVDYTRTIPPLIDSSFPGTPTDDVFWSSSAAAGTANDFWTVSFGLLFGSTNYYDASDAHYVRCVR